MTRDESASYRGSVYIPPSYRGNALSLCRIAEDECEHERNDCNERCMEAHEEHCPQKDTKCESNLITRLFSDEHGWLWVVLLVAAVLLFDKEKGSAECTGKDEWWPYLLLLLVLL